MPRPKLTREQKTDAKIRQSRYLLLYKNFENVDKCNTWIMSILNCSRTTASLWRTKNCIPDSKLLLLESKIKEFTHND